jgi:hypothetical protein
VSSHDRSATTPAGAALYTDAIRVDRLCAGPSYQRDLDPKRVNKMVNEFDHRLLGVLEVSVRADGRFAILDGQHGWSRLPRPFRRERRAPGLPGPHRRGRRLRSTANLRRCFSCCAGQRTAGR